MAKTISETALESFAFFLSLEGLQLALQHCYLQSPSPRRRQTMVHGSEVPGYNHGSEALRPKHPTPPRGHAVDRKGPAASRLTSQMVWTT